MSRRVLLHARTRGSREPTGKREPRPSFRPREALSAASNSDVTPNIKRFSTFVRSPLPRGTKTRPPTPLPTSASLCLASRSSLIIVRSHVLYRALSLSLPLSLSTDPLAIKKDPIISAITPAPRRPSTYPTCNGRRAFSIGAFPR